jgi:hypothetical protein
MSRPPDSFPISTTPPVPEDTGSMNGRRVIAVATVATLVFSARPPGLEAQFCVPPGSSCAGEQPAESRVSGELLAAGVNIAIGGLTAGVRQWRADGSFLDGLWRGALGGAGTYAGKTIVASDFMGAGLLGRSVAAAGASITRNASEGRPTFDRLILPFGFVRLHWRPSHGDVHASFDVPGIAAIAGIYLSDLGADLNLGRTLDSGAPVFMARDGDSGRTWSGRQVFGAVILRADAWGLLDDDPLLTLALRHERIHVLQHDQAYILWTEPIDHALLNRFGSPAWLVRHVDLSMSGTAASALKLALPRSFQVWEDEAHFMSGTGGDRILR